MYLLLFYPMREGWKGRMILHGIPGIQSLISGTEAGLLLAVVMCDNHSALTVPLWKDLIVLGWISQVLGMCFWIRHVSIRISAVLFLLVIFSNGKNGEAAMESEKEGTQEVSGLYQLVLDRGLSVSITGSSDDLAQCIPTLFIPFAPQNLKMSFSSWTVPMQYLALVTWATLSIY